LWAVVGSSSLLFQRGALQTRFLDQFCDVRDVPVEDQSSLRAGMASSLTPFASGHVFPLCSTNHTGGQPPWFCWADSATVAGDHITRALKHTRPVRCLDTGHGAASARTQNHTNCWCSWSAQAQRSLVKEHCCRQPLLCSRLNASLILELHCVSHTGPASSRRLLVDKLWVP
jgi:hypothetical protein